MEQLKTGAIKMPSHVRCISRTDRGRSRAERATCRVLFFRTEKLDRLDKPNQAGRELSANEDKVL